MSILLYVMFLAYLCGIQATSMDRRRLSPDPVNSLIIRLLQADIVKSKHQQGATYRTAADSRTAGGVPEEGDYPEGRLAVQLDAELLRQRKRYSSPRVLLSERPPLQPPPLYLADDYLGSPEARNRTRQKRYAEHKSYRGEYSVCESESLWVTDKSTAVDIRGREVTVLKQIKMEGADVKQYFYETKCVASTSTKRSCKGIDDRRWNSQCKTSQTFVRALASEKNSVGWRWIRIDTSCVCALSRKARRT
ncbi:NTF3 protein, partial [Atractosteus spatula]|nr:NTF3 protein [Atractosteus spatula]